MLGWLLCVIVAVGLGASRLWCSASRCGSGTGATGGAAACLGGCGLDQRLIALQVAHVFGWYIDVLGQLAVGILVQGDTALGALFAESSTGQIRLTIFRNVIRHTNSRAVLVFVLGFAVVLFILGFTCGGLFGGASRLLCGAGDRC